MHQAPRIWINAGEPSGDQHGALLARALLETRPDAVITGMGGEALIAAGQQHVAHISDLSVMGFTEVLGQLPKIFSLLRRIKGCLDRNPPDVLVCIDAPDFNFRVIRMAHARGIPVVYYISPKLWAWRKGRAKFIKRHVSRMLCILPFEKAFYQNYGVTPEYVGNPLVDAIEWQQLDTVTTDHTQIGLLPGSRRKEVQSLLPEFLAAARIMHARYPDLHFALSRAPGMDEEQMQTICHRLWPGGPVSLAPPEERHALMRRSLFCLAASGTVTLEAALLGTPTIVAYKLSPLTFALARQVVKVPWISLPNLILQEQAFPEHLQQQADAAPLAAQALDWLESPQPLQTIKNRLQRLREMLGPPGAPQRAARSILEFCDTRAAPPP